MKCNCEKAQPKFSSFESHICKRLNLLRFGKHNHTVLTFGKHTHVHKRAVRLLAIERH